MRPGKSFKLPQDPHIAPALFITRLHNRTAVTDATATPFTQQPPGNDDDMTAADDWRTRVWDIHGQETYRDSDGTG